MYSLNYYHKSAVLIENIIWKHTHEGNMILTNQSQEEFSNIMIFPRDISHFIQSVD